MPNDTQEYARAIVWGIAGSAQRKTLSADYCRRVLKWIERIAPEVTGNREALITWIAVECGRNGIELVN